MGLLGFASLALAQPPPPANWRGWATCDVTVTGPGYRDQQTQKWRTTGDAPTKSGALDLYPGTWSVTGGGSLERTDGTQRLRAEWKRNVGETPVPISVGVRASDGAILIAAAHAPLRAANAVTGTQEVRVDDKVASRTPIALDTLEYTFPSSKGAAKSPHVSGERVDSPSGDFGPMQPEGSKVEVRCLWDFQRGEARPRGSAVTMKPEAPVSSVQNDCSRPSSDLDAQYRAATQNIEVEYSQRIQQNDTRRAQLNGQIAALAAADKALPRENAQAQISALQFQIHMLDTERTQLQDDRARQLAEAQRAKTPGRCRTNNPGSGDMTPAPAGGYDRQ